MRTTPTLIRTAVMAASAVLVALAALPALAQGNASAVPRAMQPLPDNVGVLGVPTTHWLNTNKGVRFCTDRQGFFAGSLTSDHKRVDKCSRAYTLSQYVQLMAGRGAYATRIARLAQGQLTIEYVIPLPR